MSYKATVIRGPLAKKGHVTTKQPVTTGDLSYQANFGPQKVWPDTSICWTVVEMYTSATMLSYKTQVFSDFEQ